MAEKSGVTTVEVDLSMNKKGMQQLQGLMRMGMMKQEKGGESQISTKSNHSLYRAQSRYARARGGN